MMVHIDVIARVLCEHFSYNDATRLLSEIYDADGESPPSNVIPSSQILVDVDCEPEVPTVPSPYATHDPGVYP